MKKVILLLALTSALSGQSISNWLQMKKANASATTGRIDFFDNTNTYSVHVSANGSALASNLSFKFPYNSDTAGDCLVSGGLGQWNPGSCGSPVIPVTFSGSSTSPILTLTQSGAGAVLALSGGPATMSGTTFIDTSRNGTFANIAMSGNFTGTHGQNIGTTDFPILSGTFYRQSAATSGFAWSIGSTVTNVLDFRDSGSSARMTLNATGAAGFGIYLGAPTIYAQATNAVSYALKAIGYPSGTANIFIAESAGGTNYFTVGYAGALSGAHIQNIGTGDTITVAGCIGCGSGGVTSVTASSPLASSGGTTPNLTLSVPATLSDTNTTFILTTTQLGTGKAIVATSVAGSAIIPGNNSSEHPTVDALNSGSSSAINGTSISGDGITGTASASGKSGVVGTGETGITGTGSGGSSWGGQFTGGFRGVVGIATGAGNYGGEFTSGSGSTAIGVSVGSVSGIGISASGGLLGGSFNGGLQVTSGLTVNFKVTSAGVITGAHAQNIGSSDSPTFNALTVSSCSGCGVTSVTASSPLASSGGTTPNLTCSTCITTAGGQSIAGTTAVGTLTASSSITIGTNNGTTATAGAGFVVSKTGAAYSILGYDNTGACGFGVAYGGAACTSDRTLKNNVQTIGSVIAQIMALRPVTYNWNSTGASGMGLIAQEVQAAIPDFKEFLVTLNPDSGKLALSMTNIVPLLIRAVQEMQVEIDVLKGSGK